MGEKKNKNGQKMGHQKKRPFFLKPKNGRSQKKMVTKMGTLKKSKKQKMGKLKKMSKNGQVCIFIFNVRTLGWIE